MAASGAGVAQRLCNRLPRNDLGGDGEKKQASRPLQGTVNGGVVSK